MNWKNCLFVVLLFIVSSCFNQYEGEQESQNNTQKVLSEEGMQLEVKSNPKSSVIPQPDCQALLKAGQLKCEVDFSEIKEKLRKYNTQNKDTFTTALFYVEYKVNGEPLVLKSENDSIGFAAGAETKLLNLKQDRNYKLQLPLYYLRHFPAGKKVQLALHLWQDEWLSDEKSKVSNKYGSQFTDWYRDTLQRKLIDVEYLMELTVPEVYQSVVICDSIFLQNDKDWSPAGSDNTIWKSSYPDIYFSLCNEYFHYQGDSHIEKSTDEFTTPDSLPYYYYSPEETFCLMVFDHDNLSRDDVLGKWKNKISALQNNKTYCLRFGHVNKCFVRRVDKGKVN